MKPHSTVIRILLSIAIFLIASYVAPTRASESKDLKKSQTSAAKAHTSATHHVKRARASKRLIETQGPPYATRADLAYNWAENTAR